MPWILALPGTRGVDFGSDPQGCAWKSQQN